MVVFYLSILFDESRLKSNPDTKSRSKSIITRKFVIDFYRFPIIVDWLVSTFIDNDWFLSTIGIIDIITCYVLITETIFAVFSEMARGDTVFYSLATHEKGILIDSLTFINQRRSHRLCITCDAIMVITLEPSPQSLSEFQGGDWTTSRGIRSLRSMTTSFHTTSFHPLVTSFHQIVTSFHQIVTSFQV